MSTKLKTLDAWLYGLLVAIVAIMPVHALLAISLGHFIGHQAAWQAWKEVGLVLGALATGWILVTDQQLRKRISREPLVYLIGALGLLGLIVTLVNHRVGWGTALLGAKTSFEFLVALLVALCVSYTPKRMNLLVKVLLGVTSAIGVFALLQVYVLPKDFLVLLGYGSSTVPPYHLVDPAVTAIRIIASFSGPNQLGSFMIIPLAVSSWYVLRQRWLALIPLSLSAFCLYHSFSRSAWIGGAIALSVVLLLWLRGWWKLIVIAGFAALIALASTLSGPVKAMETKLSYYIFHGQFIDGHENGSDQNRLANAKHGVDLIVVRPAGYGLGTAGPASKQTASPVVTENYYLQTGIETGVMGLLLFVTIVVLTGWGLWQRRASAVMSSPLLAALIGLSATNLFLHTWADSSTALVFWVLAGYTLAAPRRKSA